MDAFARWLQATSVSVALQAEVAWLWPICETIHFMGLGLFMGVVGFFDLRLMGVVKRVSMKAVTDLLPWGILGLVVNVITGVIFLVSQPVQYSNSTAWWAKFLCLVVAGVNIVVFETMFRERANTLQAGEEPPLSLRLLGGISLAAWFGVLYFGRMMPYIGAPADAGF
jgi:hypothetical protein